MLAPVGLDWFALADTPLPVDEVVAWATSPRAGAVVSFSGVVRDHSEGRDDVTSLTYEAYEGVVEQRLTTIVATARATWPALDRVAVLHRTGDVAAGQPSVLVVVAAPHRPEAFEAARYLIDTVKAEAPIWKQEHWSGGSEWVDGTHEIGSVH